MYCPNLIELMHYKNNKIIYRYNKDYPNAKMHAEDALRELMKFIWLCLKHKSDKKVIPKINYLIFFAQFIPK